MSTYAQADRPMTVTTPLGKDDLLLVGFRGHEAISQLFDFQLDLLAENETEVPFEKLLGQKVTVQPGPRGRQDVATSAASATGSARATRDSTFTAYQLEHGPAVLVPHQACRRAGSSSS